MKKIAFVIIYCSLFLACSDDDKNGITLQWNKLGLDGFIVNELVLSNDVLYAATENGVYARHIDTDGAFQLIGLQGKNVEDIIVFSAQRILASFVDRTGAIPPALYITENGGAAWDILENDFGGDEYPEPVYHLSRHPADETTLFAAGVTVVAKSTDNGITWEPIWGTWQGFASGVAVVEVNPKAPYDIWAGGQGAIENGYLLHLKEGAEWRNWSNLVENPTVVKEIIFDAAVDQHIYVGFEGALLRTGDDGETWETVIDGKESNRFFFGIGTSSNDHRRVFAGGWIKNFQYPQPLIFYYSRDRGVTWKEETYAPEQFGGIYDLKVKSEATRDRVFLALYKGGVYEVVVPVP
jgi:hypothetical protein